MKFARNIAVAGALALQGCASVPGVHVRGMENRQSNMSAGTETGHEVPALPTPNHFDSPQQIDAAINDVRKKIARQDGDDSAQYADVLCQGNNEAIQCMLLQTDTTLQTALGRSDAMQSCYHPNPDNTETRTVDLECLFGALGSDYVSPATRERILFCRAEILTCYERLCCNVGERGVSRQSVFF